MLITPGGTRVNNPVRADALVQWLKQQNCELINTSDESTYQQYCTNGASSVLDLTFATQATAEIVTDWSICDDWSTGSDHEVIYFSILSESVEFVDSPVLSTLAYNMDKANWPEFHGVLLKGWCELSVKLGQLLGESPTSHQMDKAAELVQTYISGAADSAIPYKKLSLFSKRWWTQELSELRTLMARSRRLWKQNRDDSLLFKEFHRYRNNYFHKIREAKRAIWTNWLSQAKGNDIWQAYKYTKACKVEKLPSIQSDSGPQINFDGKYNAFIKAMYPKPPEVDLGQEADTAPRLEPWIEVTDKEIQNAIFTSSPKKALGPDLLIIQNHPTGLQDHSRHTEQAIHHCLTPWIPSHLMAPGNRSHSQEVW